MGYVMAVSGPVGMDVGGTFQRFMETLGRIVPRLIVFVVILVIGWLIAKIIERAATMILERLHFNRVAERGVVGDALRRSDYDASRLIARLLFYAVMLIALQVAFNVFGPNPISDLLRAIVAWLPRLAVAIIIVVVASAIAHAVRDIVGAALGAMAYGRLLANLSAIFIVALGIIAALNQIGIATTVTEPLLITALATIGAIIAIGVGGGLVRPMQQRWERILSAGERDVQTMRTGAYQRGREDAMRGGEVRPEGETRPHETPGRRPPERPPGSAP
jgi:hypothetical protein